MTAYLVASEALILAYTTKKSMTKLQNVVIAIEANFTNFFFIRS